MGMSQISPNERLRILQKVLGYRSQQAFADALGIKQGSLSDIYRAKNGIGVSGQIKIALSKHGVNIDWLDTGEGDMLTGSTTQTDGHHSVQMRDVSARGNVSVHTASIAEEEQTELETMREQLYVKDRTIERLLAQIDKLTTALTSR